MVPAPTTTAEEAEDGEDNDVGADKDAMGFERTPYFGEEEHKALNEVHVFICTLLFGEYLEKLGLLKTSWRFVPGVCSGSFDSNRSAVIYDDGEFILAQPLGVFAMYSVEDDKVWSCTGEHTKLPNRTPGEARRSKLRGVTGCIDDRNGGLWTEFEPSCQSIHEPSALVDFAAHPGSLKVLAFGPGIAFIPRPRTGTLSKCAVAGKLVHVTDPALGPYMVAIQMSNASTTPEALDRYRKAFDTGGKYLPAWVDGSKFIFAVAAVMAAFFFKWLFTGPARGRDSRIPMPDLGDDV